MVVIQRSGARRPAVLGDGGWLFYTDTLPAKEESSPEEPQWVDVPDGSGAVLKRIGMAP
ncbi:MAG: hypothetical protein AB7V62_04370 [Thermoleophilia bacterium]